MKFCSFVLFLYAVTPSHASTGAVSRTSSLSPSPSSFSPSPTGSVSPQKAYQFLQAHHLSQALQVLRHFTNIPHMPHKHLPHIQIVVYKLKDGNITCFMLEGSIEFAITNKLKSSKKEKKHHVVLPLNATSSWECVAFPTNEAEPLLELKFEALTFEWTFKVEKDRSWKTVNISLSGSFSDGKVKIPVDAELLKAADNKMFTASSNHHICATEQKMFHSPMVSLLLFTISVSSHLIALMKNSIKLKDARSLSQVNLVAMSFQ